MTSTEEALRMISDCEAREPMVRQPGPAHPVWDAFQEWVDRRRECA